MDATWAAGADTLMRARGLICALAAVVSGVATLAAPVAASATCAADTGWTAATLTNGFSNQNANASYGYYRDGSGWVHLGNGTPFGQYDNNVMLTLPVGYRPSGTVRAASSRYGVASGAYLEVRADGTVWPEGTSSNGALSAVMEFYAGPDCSGSGGSGMTNPMTTAQDLVVGGTSGAAGRLGVGTSGQVLAVGSGGVVGWASAASTSFSLASFTGDALATVNQAYSLVLVIGALLVLGVGYTVASGLRK